MKHLEILLIRIYQKTLSLDHGYLGRLFPNTRACKFLPTCSEYGIEALDKYGVVKGNILLFKRVIRCNPWARTGVYDPVR